MNKISHKSMDQPISCCRALLQNTAAYNITLANSLSFMEPAVTYSIPTISLLDSFEPEEINPHSLNPVSLIFLSSLFSPCPKISKVALPLYFPERFEHIFQNRQHMLVSLQLISMILLQTNCCGTRANETASVLDANRKYLMSRFKCLSSFDIRMFGGRSQASLYVFVAFLDTFRQMVG